MPRPAKVSPERILAAAAVEFAARGYAGARVDRIARRARVNKAMLYYHFTGKQGIYRALLRSTFLDLAARLQAIAAAPGEPSAALASAVVTMAAFIADHSYFPAIMLREVAEGGSHLDADSLAALASVPRAFAAIVAPGVRSGVFRTMHPLAAYFTTIAPIVMFVASTPVRKQFATHHLLDDLQAPLTQELFLRDLQQTLTAAFAAPGTTQRTPR